MNGLQHNNAGLKHWAIMIACCGIPMAVLLAVFVFKVNLGTLGLFAVMLLCPLLHIFMMKGMMGHDHKGHEHRTADTESKEKMVG